MEVRRGIQQCHTAAGLLEAAPENPSSSPSTEKEMQYLWGAWNFPDFTIIFSFPKMLCVFSESTKKYVAISRNSVLFLHKEYSLPIGRLHSFNSEFTLAGLFYISGYKADYISNLVLVK